MPRRRRRCFTPPFKAQVVLEVLAGLRSEAEIARQHRLKPELAGSWTTCTTGSGSTRRWAT
jgi:transposase-like protein